MVLSTLAALILITTLVLYFIYKPEKPWVAFYIACCGGVLIINLTLSVGFVYKNFKDKDIR